MILYIFFLDINKFNKKKKLIKLIIMKDETIEIRLIIKYVNYYNITNEISDFKFDFLYKNVLKTSDIYWKYRNDLEYNWKFIYSDKIRYFYKNDIKLILTDENVIEDNILLGSIDINIKEFLSFYQELNCPNMSNHINYSNINNIKALKIFDPSKFTIYSPGLYINSIKKSIIKDNIDVGNIIFDILILDKENAIKFKSGEGREKPNCYPFIENLDRNKNIIDNNSINKENTINIINNNISTDDEFQFNKYADAFANIINNKNLSLPLIFGLYAPKGVGKTHLLHLINNKISNNNFIKVDFNAWVFSGTDILWAGMVTALYNTVENRLGVYYTRYFRVESKLFPKTKDKILFFILIILMISLLIGSYFIYKNNDIQLIWSIISVFFSSLLTINFFKNILNIGKFMLISFSSEVKKAVSSPNFSSKLGFMNDVKNEIKDIIIPILNKKNQKMIINIDDLDKCPPDKIAEVLEAIQLLLSDDNCPFIVFISGNSNTLIKAIESNYKNKYKNFMEINGYEYLNKLITIPFSIPNINSINKLNILQILTKNDSEKVLINKYNEKLKYFIENDNSYKEKYLKNINSKSLLNNFLLNETPIDTDKMSLIEKCEYIDTLTDSNLTNIVVKKNNDNLTFLRSTNDIHDSINDYLLQVEHNINNNIEQYDNLEELYFSINKLIIQLQKKNITEFNVRIKKIKDYIINFFTIQKNNIFKSLFKEYSDYETKVFCDLSYYLGSSMNIIKSKRVINLYNLSRFILPSHLFDLRKYLIQIIIMSEFWNYRMTWVIMILEDIYKESFIKKKNIIETLQNISLFDFYNKSVNNIIQKNNDKISKSLSKTDFNKKDFLKIIKYNNIELIHLYKLNNYIFNIDQCLKSELYKIER